MNCNNKLTLYSAPVNSSQYNVVHALLAIRIRLLFLYSNISLAEQLKYLHSLSSTSAFAFHNKAG